jgi:ABC-type uncharacterized transport system permease subunit
MGLPLRFLSSSWRSAAFTANAAASQTLRSRAFRALRVYRALVVTLAAGVFPSGSTGTMFAAMLFSAVGGALFAVIHAILCVNFKANQVISGVVINILAMALTGFLTSQINGALTGAFTDKFQLGACNRLTWEAASEIPILGGFFTNIYPFEFVILLVALIAYYVLYKTPFGLRLRACGDNPHAVDAAGANVSKIRFLAVMLSGGLCGIGGICFAYSISTCFSSSIYRGYGYLAIAALIFGKLEDPSDLRRLPALWLRTQRRLQAGADPRFAEHVLRPHHDAALRRHTAAAGLLLRQ